MYKTINLTNDEGSDIRTGADVGQIEAALATADMNILRLALYQMTGDAALAEMKVVKQTLRGGLFSRTILAPEHHEDVRARALMLLAGAEIPPIESPNRSESRRLMELFGGVPLDDAEFDLGIEELAFDTMPRRVGWNRQPAQSVLDDFHTLIVGAGMSGIMAGIQLKSLGIPFTIIERQSGLGGTWELNDYPEARVDITSFLYQYTFVKNYPWPSYYATRAESLKYLHHVANTYGISDHIIYETEVKTGEWDEAGARWRLVAQHNDGTVHKMSARLLISASGLFSTPRMPDIGGIETFSGKMFHTTQWDHDYDLGGKKVALVGNGSTGTQILRYIAKTAASVDVYQRTPQWIAAAENYRENVAPEVRWLLDNVPGYWNWYCYSAHLESMPFQAFQYHDPAWQANGGQISEINDKYRGVLHDYIANQVGGDAELMAKCLPKYAPVSRRMVVDNGWYEALTYDNVNLITTGIDRIDANGILGADGVHRETDLIVLAAGFEVARYFWPVNYKGKNGITLDKAWEKDGPRAHKGMTMPGYPNFFVFYGPNSQPRVGGFYSWVEIWSRYIGELIVALIESGGATIEVKREPFEQYNAELDAEMERLTWAQEGAGGYHVRDFGRSVMHAPWTIQAYHARVKSADIENFEID